MPEGDRTRIQSFSAPAEMMERVDELMRKEGYTSRSQIVRKALAHYFALTDEGDPRGTTEGVVVAFHPREAGSSVSDLRHRFSDLVVGYSHSHTTSGLCVDVMHVAGNGARVRTLVDGIRALKGVDLVHYLNVPSG